MYHFQRYQSKKPGRHKPSPSSSAAASFCSSSCWLCACSLRTWYLSCEAGLRMLPVLAIADEKPQAWVAFSDPCLDARCSMHVCLIGWYIGPWKSWPLRFWQWNMIYFTLTSHTCVKSEHLYFTLTLDDVCLLVFSLHRTVLKWPVASGTSFIGIS